MSPIAGDLISGSSMACLVAYAFTRLPLMRNWVRFSQKLKAWENALIAVTLTAGSEISGAIIFPASIMALRTFMNIEFLAACDTLTAILPPPLVSRMWLEEWITLSDWNPSFWREGTPPHLSGFSDAVELQASGDIRFMNGLFCDASTLNCEALLRFASSRLGRNWFIRMLTATSPEWSSNSVFSIVVA